MEFCGLPPIGQKQRRPMDGWWNLKVAIEDD